VSTHVDGFRLTPRLPPGAAPACVLPRGASAGRADAPHGVNLIPETPTEEHIFMPNTQVALESGAQSIEEKIRSRAARVGIIGLGYVGLPLAVEFAGAGFDVTGIDVNEGKTRKINSGQSYVGDVSTSLLSHLVDSRHLRATTDFSVIAELDTVNVCVPTPLRKTKDPDMSYIVAACKEIARYLHPGMLVILESTTYPGTTDELVLPMLAQSGLQVGKDFFLCFSPERVDPGNPKYQTRNIPKVVGGVTPACTAAGALFYSQALQQVVPVGSTQVAEMVKLLENTFRLINIGLVNELALMCERMGINVWAVIEAAATKPFGFMPFYPGPGLGGHCIPIDPFYLSWKTKQAGIEARFIELAGYINGQMPQFVVDKVQNALNEVGKPVKGSRVHVMGVAYKRDIDDVRESPAIDIILLLQKRGAVLSYSDPHVPELRFDGLRLEAQPEWAAADADCAVIVTDHAAFDYDGLLARAPLIVDSRNALAGRRSPKIVRL
jgi:UDP-N-acetyl-D-glucosamine dehydrogenase